MLQSKRLIVAPPERAGSALRVARLRLAPGSRAPSPARPGSWPRPVFALEEREVLAALQEPGYVEGHRFVASRLEIAGLTAQCVAIRVAVQVVTMEEERGGQLQHPVGATPFLVAGTGDDRRLVVGDVLGDQPEDVDPAQARVIGQDAGAAEDCVVVGPDVRRERLA